MTGQEYITEQLGSAQIKIANLIDGIEQRDHTIERLATELNTLKAALTNAQKKRLGLEVDAPTS